MFNQDYKMTINYNPAFFKILLKHLKPKNKEKILDIGCSRGFYVKEMEKYTEGIIGVDVDRVSLEKAVSDKVEYADATKLNFKDGDFDKIYSLHTVEHVSDLERFFLEAARILKPGGIAIITYPLELFRGAQCMISACLMYKNPLMAQKLHLHKLTPNKIKEIIKNTSFFHMKSRLVFTLSPLSWQYFTVLKKI